MPFATLKAAVNNTGLPAFIARLLVPSSTTAAATSDVMTLAGFHAAFPNDVLAADRPQAESRARADHEAIRGKLIETTYVFCDGDEFRSASGKPFVVRVLGGIDLDNLCQWTDEAHLDPYWDVEIVNGRGIVPEGVTEDCYAYVYGRSHLVPMPAPRPASAPAIPEEW